MSVEKQRLFWNSMASRNPDAGVIDPRDLQGHKNRYIGELRNYYFLEELRATQIEGPVLDFGCGTGLAGEFLTSQGYQTVGVDISPKLLSYGKKVRPDMNFVQFDGKVLPFKSECFSSIVVYGVFIYVEEDAELKALFDELYRVLKPGGKLIAIDQTTSKRSLIKGESKTMRRTADYVDLLQQANFVTKAPRTVRFARFPLTYLIRYGLFPRRLNHIARWLEKITGMVIRSPSFSYVDTQFFAGKPMDDATIVNAE